MKAARSSHCTVMKMPHQGADVLADIIAGLTSPQPSVPAKLHYDERGSELFEQICDLPEYYLTRVESSMMDRFAPEIAAAVGPETAIVEPGSGASKKTETLIDAIDRCAAYIPIDISKTMLRDAAERVNARFPGVPVIALHGDFTQPMRMPAEAELGTRRLIYFPGSTIGNFAHEQQLKLLRSFRQIAGRTGALLIGFDLMKDIGQLEAAYNDEAGVTAEFNLNVVDRMETEFGFGISRQWFDYHATWEPGRGAVVSRLIANRDAVIRRGDTMVKIKAGDGIETEESHKYTLDRFSALAESAGLAVRRVWTDDDQRFAVALAEPEGS